MPKYLIQYSLFNCLSLILRQKLRLCTFFWGGWNITKFDLSMLRDNLLAQSQLIKSYRTQQTHHTQLLRFIQFHILTAIALFLSWWQPTDLTEPNPITILLLCIHLYQRLPHYLPRATVAFEGPLHDTVTKHVSLFLLSSDTLGHYFTLYSVACCIHLQVNLALLFCFTLSQKLIVSMPSS